MNWVTKTQIERLEKNLRFCFSECGGVILTNKYVLTSAECVIEDDNTQSYVTVHVGEYKDKFCMLNQYIYKQRKHCPRRVFR